LLLIINIPNILICVPGPHGSLSGQCQLRVSGLRGSGTSLRLYIVSLRMCARVASLSFGA
jgi:hypothetical protein